MGVARAELTMDTYIRKMPHSAFQKLATLLDPENFWERFAIEIPMKLEQLGEEGAELRYGHLQIETFRLHGSKHGGSSTKRVLQDWGTKNSRISHLIKVLVTARLYQAADYLHNNLLHLGPVPRPDEEQAAPDGRDTENGSVSEGASHDPSTSCAESPSACQPFSEQLSSVGSVRVEEMSCFSDGASALDEGENMLSRLQREISISDEGSEQAWRGLQDIQIQTINYSMLGAITSDFNEQPLEKGGNMIGSGGFGVVYMGQFHNGFKIAVKCLKVADQLKEEDLLKQFETEVHMLSRYRHENILHLLGYSTDGPAPCLVYQYLPNGSLEDRLACLHGTPPLSADQRLKIIQGAADGIVYLNGEKYVHRDIKSANILLDSEFTAKVGDFATACRAPGGSGMTTEVNVSVVIGTPAYLAPEAYRFDVSTKLDAYSFGVVLLEVITGLPAQDKSREDDILQYHISEKVDDPSEIHEFVDPKAGEWGPGTIDTIYDVACRCLTEKKRHRPNVVDVKPELDSLTDQTAE